MLDYFWNFIGENCPNSSRSEHENMRYGKMEIWTVSSHPEPRTVLALHQNNFRWLWPTPNLIISKIQSFTFSKMWNFEFSKLSNLELVKVNESCSGARRAQSGALGGWKPFRSPFCHISCFHAPICLNLDSSRQWNFKNSRACNPKILFSQSIDKKKVFRSCRMS